MSRNNDVEVSLLQLRIQRGTVVICQKHQLSLVSLCLDVLATKPTHHNVAPLVKWTKFMINYSTVRMSGHVRLQKLVIHRQGNIVLGKHCIPFVMEKIIDLICRHKNNEHDKYSRERNPKLVISYGIK